MSQAPPFVCNPYSDFFFCNDHDHDHDHSPDQGFGFDEARRHHSDLSCSESSLTRHSFRKDGVQKHLERNRAAASKSRQKKKRETDQLETRFNKVSRKKRPFEEEIKGLHRDLLYLKDQILIHYRCDDNAIYIYLGHMVKQASKHGSMSSASTEGMAAKSESPPEMTAQSCQAAEQGVRALFSPGQTWWNVVCC
jgi:hypothetical protein